MRHCHTYEPVIHVNEYNVTTSCENMWQAANMDKDPGFISTPSTETLIWQLCEDLEALAWLGSRRWSLMTCCLSNLSCTHTHTQTHHTHTHTCTNMYTRLKICLCLWVCVCMCMRACTRPNANVVCMCNVFVCTCVYMCVCIRQIQASYYQIWFAYDVLFKHISYTYQHD